MDTTIANKANTAGKVKFYQRKSFKKNIFVICMLAWPLIQFAIFWVYVNANTFALTFQQYDLFGVHTGKPKSYYFIGLENYINLFKSFFFPREMGGNIILKNAFFNASYSFFINIIVLLPLSVVCAYVLSFRIKGEGIFRTLFYIPNIISMTVLIMLYKYMFDYNFGPLNALLRLFGQDRVWFDISQQSDVIWPLIVFYCIWAGLGVNMILMSSAISRIPPEILESCHLDGIGFWRQLWSIVIPLVWSTISTLVVLGIISTFNFFMHPYLMAGSTGGYQGQTMTVPIYIFNTVQMGNRLGYTQAATMGIFTSVIAIPIIFLAKWGTEKIYSDIEF